MMKLSYEQIVEKIKEKKGLSEEEIDKRVQEKLEQLAGLISKDGAAHIIANELGINVFEETGGKLKLAKLIPGMRSVEALGKVQAVYEVREFSTARGSGKVGSFLVADDTSMCRVTCWNAQTEKMAEVFRPFDYGRFEFRFNEATGEANLLEVNLQCNLWSQKVYGRSAVLMGWSQEDLIESLVAESLRRHGLMEPA